jgi:hypothetical protein
MYVLKNIGPLKMKGKVVCRFLIGKSVPEIALKHWGKDGAEQLKKAGIIGDKNESIRQSESGQQTDIKPGIRGNVDSKKQGGNASGNSGPLDSD